MNSNQMDEAMISVAEHFDENREIVLELVRQMQSGDNGPNVAGRELRRLTQDNPPDLLAIAVVALGGMAVLIDMMVELSDGELTSEQIIEVMAAGG
jgi:hypothetical protein